MIEYQQAKRSYYRFEDRVAQTLRATIRRLELNQLNFEQQRLAVVGAIDQVVLNDEIFALSEQRGDLQAGMRCLCRRFCLWGNQC